MIECSLCGKVYTLKQNMVRHKKKAHPIVKFPCAKCHMQYSYEKNLIEHLKKTGHGNPVEIASTGQSLEHESMADKTVPPIKIINRRFVTRNIANPTPTTSTETINMSVDESDIEQINIASETFDDNIQAGPSNVRNDNETEANDIDVDVEEIGESGNKQINIGSETFDDNIQAGPSNARNDNETEANDIDVDVEEIDKRENDQINIASETFGDNIQAGPSNAGKDETATNDIIAGLKGVSVKDEREDDPEINAMAIQMKENFQKNATATATAALRQNSSSNVYINRAGRAVTLNTAVLPNFPPRDTIDRPPNNSPDAGSEKGHFGWEEIGTCNVPYIQRIIDGFVLNYVSVRVAENQLLTKYLHFLHSDIYTCTSVKSHFINECEAKLLNAINVRHSDQLYGKDSFVPGKDFIVRLEDVREFYAFLEVCYKKLLCNIAPGRREKCGFIRINSESVVPYCIKENQKYVPLFYFEGETDNLRHRAIKLEHWHLAYLKFCCKVQGIRNELFASDSCTVTSLDDIKNYFPPDTNFEEYWPAKVVDTQLLTNTKNTSVNVPGAWIRVPHPSENPYATTLPPPAPPTPAGPPPSVPIWNSTQASTSTFNMQGQQQVPPPSYTVTRSQSAAAQYYNTSTPLIQQNNNSLNGSGHAVPPPLVRAVSSMPGTSGSYSSNVPMNHTTMYNPASATVVSHANQLRQFYGSQRSISTGHIQPQQQMITISQAQQPFGSQSIQNLNSGRMTNTQQRNAMRNSTVPASEIIDLSSPPSSPTPQSDSSRANGNPWDLKKIPERPWGHDQQNNAAYKIQKATLQGKVLYCINAKPFIYSDLMLTLDDLVQCIFPTSTVARCAQILQKYLKTTLYSGNTEQMMVLRENGRLRSLIPDDTPLAMLQDITHVFLQLKSLMGKQDEQIQQYQTSGPSKRQRMS